MKKLLVLSVFLTGALLCYYLPSCSEPNVSGYSEGEKISYNFQVRPILSDKCLKCHGPDANKREAGLRLDIAEEAYKSLKEHPRSHAIVRGKPELSEMFLRVSSKDTSYVMPPPSTNLPALTESEISVIKKWIEQGAKYEPHWAFVAPIKPALPKVENKKWVRNEIDYFVLQQLEKRGLEPNEEADKERLLKRVSLDLAGLPSTTEQIDRFVADKAPNAFEKMVDELMRQPQFGERMAINWLDVARYADSHGYQDDNYRSQWPWRDWVIHAFNKNMPYDKFITWQLAGDLIPDATKEHLLATGFKECREDLRTIWPQIKSACKASWHKSTYYSISPGIS